MTPEEFDQTKAAAASLEATLKADEAAVKNAAPQLEYCTIAVPVDGRTGNSYAPGNVVKANDDKGRW